MENRLQAFKISEDATDSTPIHEGFTIQQLQDAWDKLRNPDDWKDVVKAPVTIRDLSVSVAAVTFFTATRPVIINSPKVMGDDHDPTNDPEGCYYLWAQGYRNGPAGDH